MKTLEQQGLQAIQRSRDLLVQERTALSNHLRGLLMEFGVVMPQGFAALQRKLPEVLEDGDNELPDLYRATLNLLHQRLLELRADIETMTKDVEQRVKAHPVCHKLTALEGIGAIGALSLYAVRCLALVAMQSRDRPRSCLRASSTRTYSLRRPGRPRTVCPRSRSWDLHPSLRAIGRDS